MPDAELDFLKDTEFYFRPDTGYMNTYPARYWISSSLDVKRDILQDTEFYI